MCKEGLKCNPLQINHPCICGLIVGSLEIYCVYLSPSASPREHVLLNEFLSSRSKDTLIIGDFNHPDVDWVSLMGSSQVDMDFLAALSDGFLDQLVVEPTHNAGNILDLVLTRDNCAN